MDRARASATRPSRPWGLVGMLVLVAAVEVFVGRGRDRFADFAAQDWTLARRRAGREARSAKVLCFGDSQVKMGVVPRVIEARVGLPAYNLALVGGQPASSYYLLRRALDSGANPSAVVVDFLPPLLAIDLERNHRNYPELLTFGESAELAFAARDPGAFLGRTVEMILPSVKTRNDLRAAVFAALQGKPMIERGDAAYPRNWRFNLGTMLFPAYPFTENPESWYRANYPAPWSCTGLHGGYVRRFLDLAATRGIAVYWLLHPIAPTAQRYCDERGQDARYEQFVRDAAARYPNLVVVDGRHSGYRETEFIDTVHLHAAASFVLSEDLASVIAGPPTQDRWVSLPLYAARLADVPVETLVESRSVLERAGAIRR